MKLMKLLTPLCLRPYEIANFGALKIDNTRAKEITQQNLLKKPSAK